MTHTDDCCCVWCESVKMRAPADVVAWRAMHRYHGAFAGVFDEQPFPHVRDDWYWLVCECGARLLVGDHPLQGKQARKRLA